MGINNKQRMLQSKIDHICFSVQNSEADFWAGFIAADGCITNKNEISISLQRKDEYFLKIFANWCGVNHKISQISHFNKKYNKLYLESSLKFTSKEMINDLNIYYNIVPRKSLILKPPKRKSLDFVSGYWMGDGGIHHSGHSWQTSFRGTKEMLGWIKTYFVDLSNANIRESKICSLSYTGRNLVPKICDRLFNNSPFYLQRKYDKYKEMINENI